MSDLTYAPIGATRDGKLPPGYRQLRYRMVLGTGADLERRAAEAVVTFRMHRAAGARISSSGARAAPGVRVTVGLGPLRAPCEVVWASPAGFGFGTLAGHPASGEEAFRVHRDEQDRVWFTVTAFSRPATPLMRAAGPLAVLLQHAHARWCGRALRRLCTVKA